MGDKCPYHDELAKNVNSVCQNIALLQKDIEYLRRDQEIILSRLTSHVNEADQEGGWHDKIRKLEVEAKEHKESLAVFRKFQLLYSAIGGIVGGIVGSKSPELILEILKHFR